MLLSHHLWHHIVDLECLGTVRAQCLLETFIDNQYITEAILIRRHEHVVLNV